MIITLETTQQGAEYGQVFLIPNTIKLLRSLAGGANEWWAWIDSIGDAVFVLRIR